MRILKKEVWPFRILVNSKDSVEHDVTDIEIWLDKNYGKFRGRWNAVYSFDKTYFYFRNQNDATLFALRWAS